MLTFAVIAVCVIVIQQCKCFPQKEALHEYLSEPELAYIFNTNERNAVSDYEIVYLPFFKATEAIGENNEESIVNYAFSAFGR